MRSQALSFVVLLGVSGAAAQNAKPAPASPSDFDFLEGRWTVVYNSSQPGIPPDVKGTWTAEKRADGRVLEDEFRLLGPNGEPVVMGMTYRVFDHTQSQWDMRYVGVMIPGPGGAHGGVLLPAQWAELTAWREGNTMRVDQRGEGADLRITYYNIGKDRFSWKADVSIDGGKTWRKDQIMIEAARVR